MRMAAPGKKTRDMTQGVIWKHLIAHAHADNEHQVQHNVDHRADDQEVQRPTAVAHRTQDARTHVIHTNKYLFLCKL